MAKLSNLTIKRLDFLDWSEGKRAESLEIIRQWVLEQAESTFNWYIENKKPKHLFARVSRGLSIVLAAVATVLPVIGQIMGTSSHPVLLNPLWSTVLATATGILIALDRFMGWSSAWTRFMVAGMELRNTIQDFELNWQQERCRWSAPIDLTETERALALVRAFSNKVGQIVRDETAAWVAEFQNAIRQLEEQTKLKPDASVPPAINITLTNGDQCDASGWEIVTDLGAVYKKSGKTAALTGLALGNRVLTVTGKIGERFQRAEKAVTVTPGSAVTIEMTLA